MSDQDVVGDPGRSFEERPGLSRRQLLAAGAWAAPVLVLATAAPAAAASTTTTYLTLTIEKFALKTPINNGKAEYEYQIRVTSPVTNDHTTGDVLQVTVFGLTTAPFTGTVSGGGLTWGAVSTAGGSVTGTRANGNRGQVTQGTFTLDVTTADAPALAGKITLTARVSNANNQSSNSGTAGA